MSFAIRLALAWAVNAAALWVANSLWDSVRIHGWAAYLIGAAVLGVANTLLKPVLALLTLPLIVLSLGFFLLVINIGMLGLPSGPLRTSRSTASGPMPAPSAPSSSSGSSTGP